MMVPRFRIAWLMVAVAIAAVDFAATRAALSHLYDGAGDGASLIAGCLTDGERFGGRHADRLPASHEPWVPFGV